MTVLSLSGILQGSSPFHMDNPSEPQALAILRESDNFEYRDKYELVTKPSVLIGRDLTAVDIVYNQKNISRQHAVLYKPDPTGSFYLKDLGSTNGTHVNGMRISTIKLRDGDELLFGDLIGDHVCRYFYCESVAQQIARNESLVPGTKTSRPRRLGGGQLPSPGFSDNGVYTWVLVSIDGYDRLSEQCGIDVAEWVVREVPRLISELLPQQALRLTSTTGGVHEQYVVFQGNNVILARTFATKIEKYFAKRQHKWNNKVFSVCLRTGVSAISAQEARADLKRNLKLKPSQSSGPVLRASHVTAGAPTFLKSPEPSLGPALEANPALKIVRDACKAKKLALFVGSGLSLGKDISGKFPDWLGENAGFPRWREIPDRMLRACMAYSLMAQEICEAERSTLVDSMSLGVMLSKLQLLRNYLDLSFERAMREIFSPDGLTHGDAHEMVMLLELPLIITTNYDELLESAEPPPKRTMVTWLQSATVLGELDAGRKVLFKIHGTARYGESIVLGELDYHRVRANASYVEVLKHLLQKYTFLFLGYGASDPLDLDIALRTNAEYFRQSATRHYLVSEPVDSRIRDRLKREYNTEVIEYANHDDLLRVLKFIRDDETVVTQHSVRPPKK